LTEIVEIRYLFNSEGKYQKKNFKIIAPRETAPTEKMVAHFRNVYILSLWSIKGGFALIRLSRLLLFLLFFVFYLLNS